MFETLKRLFIEGRLTEAGLSGAVIKGWITRAQADEIMAARK